MTGLVRRREKEKRGNQKKRYPNKEPDDRKYRYGAYHEKGPDREHNTPNN
jgi:hypothetical protein